MNDDSFPFVHRAQSWRASLVKSDRFSAAVFILSVHHELYDTDPGRGQNHVVSALYKACELLRAEPFSAGSRPFHSGGSAWLYVVRKQS